MLRHKDEGERSTNYVFEMQLTGRQKSLFFFLISAQTVVDFKKMNK